MLKTCKRNHSYSLHLKRCPKCTSLSKRKWRENNSEKIKEWRKLTSNTQKEHNKRYRNNNPEGVKISRLKFRKNHPEKIRADNARRRAKRKCATPSWLTETHHKEILEFYKKARELEKETGRKHHVDHIIPLGGENVSGLHVPWNLQILEAIENIKKGNKIE